jgi:hypothetical protein
LPDGDVLSLSVMLSSNGGPASEGFEKIAQWDGRPRLSSLKSGRISPFRLRRMTGTSGLSHYFL